MYLATVFAQKTPSQHNTTMKGFPRPHLFLSLWLLAAGVAACSDTVPPDTNTPDTVSEDTNLIPDTNPGDDAGDTISIDTWVEDTANEDIFNPDSEVIPDTETDITTGIDTSDAITPDDIEDMDIATTDTAAPEDIEQPEPCEECPEGMTCKDDICQEVICVPEESFCTEEGLVSKCGPFGVDYYIFPCAAGFECYQGVCKPPRANIILIFDTSGSMDDWVTSGSSSSWPTCESLESPQTKMGVSKAAFNLFLENPPSTPIRLALARFPQAEVYVNFPQCSSGYYTSKSTMTGDDGSHKTGPTDDWFTENMDQVIVVPFSDGDESNNEVQAWINGTEEIEELPDVSCGDCPSNLCNNGACYIHTDPELRPTGSTPIGRTLFYAGEYLRRFVLVDHKPCSVDSDCGSPNHYCAPDGTCLDPMAECRETIILLFTDGGETDNTFGSDFFNPINQAKRMGMGLGCPDANPVCAGEAVCMEENCMLMTGSTVTADVLGGTDLGLCTTSMTSCDLLAFGEECSGGYCNAVENLYSDDLGVQALYGWDYAPQSVRIHVIDASPFPEQTNLEIAFWGNGEYINVNLQEPEALLEAVQALTDIKPNLACQ